MKNNQLLAVLIIILALVLLLLRIFVTFIPTILVIMAFIALYCIVMIVAQIFVKRSDPAMMAPDGEKPFVNIIIPAHNEEFVLKDTIENLILIDYPNFDILIVDDRSKDKTREIAKALSEKYNDKVKYYTRPEDAFPGKSAVLNDALKITNADYVCIFDADVKVEKDFLTKMVPAIKPDNVAAVQARKVISNKDYNFLTRCQYYEYCSDTNIQIGRDTLNAAVELRGNGELLKRSAINAVGGWNDYTLTDDLDLSTKFHINGYNIRFCESVFVYEEAITALKPIIKQRKRWAEGSIRRYLDYFFKLIFSHQVPFKFKLDALAYFSEFVLPMWIVFDLVIQVILFVLGKHPTFMLDLFCLSFVGMFFILLSFFSIRKYESFGILESFKWAVYTSLYFITLWLSVVFVVVGKIIFLKRDMCWNKTEHLGDINYNSIKLEEGS